MGVPKLFRFLAERYALINRSAVDLPLPQCDNLYLDLNGIIHNCSHPNVDGDISVALEEKEIIAAICAYIDRLVTIAEPRKLLYIAIDGVAPRAKMNQQRQRRFRVARLREAAAREAAALARGDVGSDGEEDDDAPTVEDLASNGFDSNCITPGTDFMSRLEGHLSYFIQRKIHEDRRWRSMEVILSGPGTPGEGEHKIIEYIRTLKSSPEHDSKTRHILYGLDADLIMLALATHEPHFQILREKVVFRQPRKGEPTASISLQKTNEFEFLSVSILREMIHLEFAAVIGDLQFEYSLERVIDDAVFLSFLVGNDFLPPLPLLEIDVGGIQAAFDAYRAVLPTMDSYLCDGGSGTVNRDALGRIFTLLAQRERDSFLQRIQKGLTKRKAGSNGKDDADADSDNESGDEGEGETGEAGGSGVPAGGDDNNNDDSGSGAADSTAAAAAPPDLNNSPAVAEAVAQLKSSPASSPAAVSPSDSRLAAAAASLPAQPPQQQQQQQAPQHLQQQRPPPGPVAIDPRGQVVPVAVLPSHPTASADEEARLRSLVLNKPAASLSAGQGPAAPAEGEAGSPAAAAAAAAAAASPDARLPPMMTPAQLAAHNIAAAQHAQEMYRAALAAHAQQLAHARAAHAAQRAAQLQQATNELKAMIMPKNDGSGPAGGEGGAGKEAAGEGGEGGEGAGTAAAASDIDWKTEGYYSVKFVDEMTPELLRDVCGQYVEGLAWVLHYYYQGVVSWSWFMGHHFAPLASDMGILNELEPSFPPSKPFMPFEQLLGVLPPASAGLLPEPLRPLMSEDSPIADFYPTDYEFIYDPKGREWKNVALIPFIDEERLLQAMAEVDTAAFSEEEAQRNALVPPLRFVYDRNASSTAVSVFDEPFVDVAGLNVAVERMPFNQRKTAFKPVPGPEPGRVQSSTYTLPYNAKLQMVGVKTVAGPSHFESWILRPSLACNDSVSDAESLGRMILGRFVYTNWPYVVKSKVVGVADADWHFALQDGGSGSVSQLPTDNWRQLVDSVSEDLLLSRGISVGPVKIMLFVKRLTGVDVNADGSQTEVYDRYESSVPLQLAVKSHPPDPRVSEMPPRNVTDVAVGTKVIYIGGDAPYGSVATVTRTTEAGLDLFVESRDVDEFIGSTFAESERTNYTPMHEVARNMGLGSLSLARLTSVITIEGGVNLGLSLKFSKRGLRIPGYTKKVPTARGSTWGLSNAGVRLIRAFNSEFPGVLQTVNRYPHDDVYTLADLFPNAEDKEAELARALAWTASSPAASLPLVPEDCQVLSPESIAGIEEALANTSTAVSSETLSGVELTDVIVPEWISARGKRATGATTCNIGDRVVNISDVGPVPLGLGGFVVSTQRSLIEVVFDNEFMCGTKLDGRLNSLRGAVVEESLLRNVSRRPRRSTPRAAAAAPAEAKPKQVNLFDLLGDE